MEEQANREFQVAKYYERRSCYGSARFYYKCLISEFPTSQKAKEAKEQIEKIRTLPDEPPKYFAWLTDMSSRTRDSRRHKREGGERAGDQETGR